MSGVIRDPDLPRLQPDVAVELSGGEERNLELLFDSLRDFFFVLDGDGKIERVNAVVERRLGYTREELVGRHVLEIHPPDRREEAGAIVLGMLEGTCDSCPVPLLAKDGTLIPVETVVTRGTWGGRGVLVGVSRDLTAVRRAEAALGESEKAYRQVVEALSEGVLLTDGERLLAANPAAKRILGIPESTKTLMLPPAEMRPTYGEDGCVVPDSGLPAFETLRDGLPRRDVVLGFDGVGSGRTWISLSTEPLEPGPDGLPAKVLLSFVDVTARRRSEEAVARRDAVLRGVAVAAERLLGAGRWEEHLDEVLASLGTASGVSRVVLLQADPVLGGAERLVVRGAWLDPAARIDRESLPAEFLPRNAGLGRWTGIFARGGRIAGPVRSFEAGERRSLEAIGIVSMVAVPVMVGGAWWGTLGFEDLVRERDFSSSEVDALDTAARLFAAAIERARADEALRRSEARTKTLLEALPDVLFRVDADGVVTDVHAGRGAMPLAGALQRGGLREGFSRGARALESAVRRVLAVREGERVQVSLGDGGSGQYEVALVPAGDGEVVGVARDVTERVRLEQVKSDFVNRAAHELRTPLTTIVVMADLIREGGRPEEVEEYWRILSGELQRQRLLIERLLTVGKMETGSLPIRPVSCDVGAVLSGAVDAAGALARARGVSLSASVPVGLPRVVSDPSLLPQVFSNLLDNAVKFTPAGGRVSVEASLSGTFVRVRVSDTGIGIPSEEVPQLFGRFFRASNAAAGEIPGSGMGLYVVRNIVERSGGRIELKSELGGGTTVDVALLTVPQ